MKEKTLAQEVANFIFEDVMPWFAGLFALASLVAAAILVVGGSIMLCTWMWEKVLQLR